MTENLITHLTIFVGFVTALITLGATLWNRREIANTQAQVQEVHVLVNSQLTSVIDRVAQLEKLLLDKGIDVPDKPDS